jgi:hypothetical protein
MPGSRRIRTAELPGAVRTKANNYSLSHTGTPQGRLRRQEHGILSLAYTDTSVRSVNP